MVDPMKHCCVAALLLLVSAAPLAAQWDAGAVQQLLNRVLRDRARQVTATYIPSENQQDVFEIEAIGNRIHLRGNNGIAVASALYTYLQQECHILATWNDTQLSLPKQLPLPAAKTHRNTSFNYRYYLNYCTFNYSMSWWNWERWEKEIDWMAMHGINMPLAITGEEYTWYLVYKEMGLSDEDLKPFFCGPSYFSWFWMGNLDGWGGPLPLSWMQSHFQLQKKILQRQRALGMKPVLPAFTGHIPKALTQRFPGTKFKTANWTNGFADTYILDANDPLFTEIGKRFLKTQTELLGTDHLYSADTFNENEPASDDPAFLSSLSAKVYEGMRSADPDAVWVMQGWLFYSDRKFWKEPQTEALLSAVPDDKMILLDLATEIEPVWKRTKAFYGKPWIWNMLHNFGGNTNLFGRMETVAAEPAKALASPDRKNLKGIGLTMEGIEQNPVLYELMMQHTWRNTPVALDEWLPAYVRNRYGTHNAAAVKAWDILRRTVYSVPQEKYIRDGAESIIQGRPTLDSSTRWARTKLNYAARDLLPAWDALLQASTDCHTEGYKYDLVDLTRQVLANYASPLQQSFAAAYRKKDINACKRYSKALLELITDMDTLLATRPEFLLGKWISDARAWGNTAAEKKLYEFNAKDLITLWGDENCPLNEYACRQWSGLMNSFYKPRWEKFFSVCINDLSKGKETDFTLFAKEIRQWEWNWVNQRKDYPVRISGNPVKVVTALYSKYRKRLEAIPY
jgi:alpha-N-acetylglucosaminidase